MQKLNLRQIVIILVHALVGWALCGATMFVGMAVTTMQNTLIIHAIAAALIFIVLSYIYFRWFNFTAPLQTAVAFILVVIFMDVFVVSLLINKSFVMFTSVLGTWIPIAEIFLATYLTGTVMKNRAGAAVAA